MNLTYGDLIIVEISLVTYMKDLDLSMQSGQYLSELLGKIEYQMSEMRQRATVDKVPTEGAPPLTPTRNP